MCVVLPPCARSPNQQARYDFLNDELQQAPRPRPASAKATACRAQQEQLGVVLQVRRSLTRGGARRAGTRLAVKWHDFLS